MNETQNRTQHGGTFEKKKLKVVFEKYSVYCYIIRDNNKRRNGILNSERTNTSSLQRRQLGIVIIMYSNEKKLKNVADLSANWI